LVFKENNGVGGRTDVKPKVTDDIDLTFFDDLFQTSVYLTNLSPSELDPYRTCNNTTLHLLVELLLLAHIFSSRTPPNPAKMALSSSQIIFLCAIGIVLLAKPAHAFGAGNIGSTSKVEGENWRHGDLEDTLLTLVASRAMGGKKFSKLDVKRVSTPKL
jgi:hypothetical protein